MRISRDELVVLSFPGLDRSIRLPVHPLAQWAIADGTGEVTMEVAALLKAIDGEMPRRTLQGLLGLKNADHFRKAYLVPAIAAGCLEMTLPNQPNSRMQRYRLTALGKQRRTELLGQP